MKIKVVTHQFVHIQRAEKIALKNKLTIIILCNIMYIIEVFVMCYSQSKNTTSSIILSRLVQ